MLKHDARVLGLADLPRKSFLAYLGYFVVAFIAEWMPSLGPRGIFNYAMLVIPVTALDLRGGGHCAVAAAPVAAAGDGARRRRRRGRIGARADIRAACPPQLCRSPCDRLADGGLSALLPAARRDRAARRIVAGRRASNRRDGTLGCSHSLLPGRLFFACSARRWVSSGINGVSDRAMRQQPGLFGQRRRHRPSCPSRHSSRHANAISTIGASGILTSTAIIIVIGSVQTAIKSQWSAAVLSLRPRSSRDREAEDHHVVAEDIGREQKGRRGEQGK